MEPPDPYSLEDPLRPEYFEGFETVRQHSTTPLAIGEVYANPWDQLRLIERDLIGLHPC